MSFVEVVKTVIGVSGIPEEDLLWVLPFVGIVVVLSAQTLLAVVLSLFKYISNEPVRVSPKSSASRGSKPVDSGELSEKERRAEEVAAISAAIMLYMQDETSYVNITESPHEGMLPWTAYHRGHQTTRAQRWKSLKR